MSGIVGSRFNIRGSGLVGSLGTDGQVFTSSGAGKSAVFEAAADGGKIGQVIRATTTSGVTLTSTTATDSGLTQAITPSATSSKILIQVIVQHRATPSGDCGFRVIFFRDSTNVYQSVHPYAFYYLTTGSSSDSLATHDSFAYIDSPSSTSSLTYKVQYQNYDTTEIQYQSAGNESQMILWEILA